MAAGRRREDVTGDPPIPPDPRPGDYWRARRGEDWAWEWWAIVPASGYSAASIAKHDVTEHEDGTITANPSILMRSPPRPDWHGYLEAGEWREA